MTKSKGTLTLEKFHAAQLNKIVTIKNSTSETIELLGQFAYKSHKPYTLDFSLNSGDVDSWRYKTGDLEETLDKGLKR